MPGARRGEGIPSGCCRARCLSAPRRPRCNEEDPLRTADAIFGNGSKRTRNFQICVALRNARGRLSGFGFISASSCRPEHYRARRRLAWPWIADSA